MPIDGESFRVYTTIAQWVFNVIVAIWMWWSRKHKVATDKIDGFDKKLNETKKDLCKRISENDQDHIRIRSEMNALPSRDQFETLSKDMQTLSSSLSNTCGRLEGVNRAVDLINEFLINQGKKK